MDYSTRSVELHRENRGKLEVISKIPIKNKEDLSLAYTPGVAQPCLEIEKNPEEWYELTSSANTVAVITDGTAVLGLGDIGPKASLPVMEGKCALFKEFAGVNAFPLALDTKDVDEFIKTVKNLAPSFGGINLEDISAPRCFEIEERLKAELNIPVFHDDQHGTAIVVLAGIINGLKITGKSKEELKVVINGAGAAGIAIAKLLKFYGVEDIILCDTKGIISAYRQDLTDVKKDLLKISNKNNISGSLFDAMKGMDVFIGVSKGNLLNEKDIKNMAEKPMIFAMANPIPEIMPDIARNAGASIVATGRSDFPNQLNNVLVFPGIFKGAMKMRVQISDEMKVEAAKAIAELVENPNPDKIIPSPFDKGVSEAVANAIEKLARNTN